MLIQEKAASERKSITSRMEQRAALDRAEALRNQVTSPYWIHCLFYWMRCSLAAPCSIFRLLWDMSWRRGVCHCWRTWTSLCQLRPGTRTCCCLRLQQERTWSRCHCFFLETAAPLCPLIPWDPGVATVWGWLRRTGAGPTLKWRWTGVEVCMGNQQQRCLVWLMSK